MKITTLKRKFKNQWVLAEVLKEDKLNRVVEVKPLVHSRERSKIYSALADVDYGKHVTTLYTGKIPPEHRVYAL